MTNASVNCPCAELPPVLQKWSEVWKTCLQNVISQISGSADGVKISSLTVPIVESDLWYTVVVGGAIHGEMILRIPESSGSSLARTFLNETAREDGEPQGVSSQAITAEHKEAVEELLRQITGLAATALVANAGGEVQLHLAPSDAPSWAPAASVRWQAGGEPDSIITVEIQISPALAAELQSRVPIAPVVSAHESNVPKLPSSSISEPSYRRLRDVGLDVKLRFGTRRMLLRDILALSAGVVVELENALHSPVDLLLDGRLIAHGDVVIVDGKYGLRVTDVIDPAPAGAALRNY